MSMCLMLKKCKKNAFFALFVTFHAFFAETIQQFAIIACFLPLSQKNTTPNGCQFINILYLCIRFRWAISPQEPVL